MSIGGSSSFRPPNLALLAEVEHACREAEDAIAEMWLEAGTPQVPVDTGELQSTGKTGRDGDRAVVSWADTDETRVYGPIQHERLDFNHPNGGNAKWGEISKHQIAPGAAVAAHAIIGAALRGRR